MTVGKLFKYGYIGHNSLIWDQIMFLISFVGIIIAAYIEGPPNRSIKYASIPITALCMLQLCVDTLKHTCHQDFVWISWSIAIGNIAGAIATWNKMPWGLFGKLSWLMVSVFSLLWIFVVHYKLHY